MRENVNLIIQIKRRIEELMREYHHQHQEQITEELISLTSR
ncbi:MAG TPA: hypothetical protein V6C82_10850 [Chroococcales cyanobacterium]